MQCSFCQRQFDTAQADKACRNCLSRGGCHNVRCPYCGGEMPMEPPSAAWLRRLLARIFALGSSRPVVLPSKDSLPDPTKKGNL